MMGKRVNYTARTVISPDPCIATDEIGIPVCIARKLTFPERVTPFNRKKLESFVINGPDYPGAEQISENGVKKHLKYISNRQHIAKTLLRNNVVVHRHMIDGDIVLVNRQPTLHKPSLMSHRVKVLNGNTIRMHYVNCNSYNADFDGDEMNIHFMQNFMAHAEGKYLCNTDENYALNGKPIRGLVQDYVIGVFHITLKDTFFNRFELNNLLVASRQLTFSYTVPAILRPVVLYTGKQLITMLMSISKSKISFQCKNKVHANYFCEHKEESIVNFHKGYFVHGMLDKSQVGPSRDGLIHVFGLLEGFNMCNSLLTSMGRVVSRYLICYGCPLGIHDLVLAKGSEYKRLDILHKGLIRGDTRIHDHFFDVFHFEDNWNTLAVNNASESIVLKLDLSADEKAAWDNVLKNEMYSTTTMVSDLLMEGIGCPFPKNKMANIILSGAKGSMVNFSQISGLLGQQSLEGGRVYLTKLGRSICSFLGTNVLSGGFVTDNFLNGLSFESFFFHCQAGREGLIDTAVKTSRSGYLQRCIVKMLENAIVHYDMSVRDNLLIQYTYGEDGINPNYAVNNKADSIRRAEFNHINKIEPGESVGVVAAQAIGEPSTQMTLNTFHLAGCATNVTLGMPRLKEILMIGSKNTNTILTANIKKHIPFNIGTVFLKDVLFFTKVVETDHIEIFFVLDRDISEYVVTQFNKMFLKEAEKSAMCSNTQVRSSKKNRGTHSATCTKDINQGSNHKNTIKDQFIHNQHGHHQHKIYSSDELLEQIKNRRYGNNVIKLSLDGNVSVRCVIEKMKNKFKIVDHGITDVEVKDNTITLFGCKYLTLFNFLADVRAYLDDYIDFYSCISNDIYNTWEVLGIEACRRTIIDEIKKTFVAYGIEIDIRHLMLIADRMTVSGEYTAFNRHNMLKKSILSKMSFENSYNFLRKAYLFDATDNLEDPSSRIVLGLPIKNGTGLFDVLYENYS